MHKNDAAPAFDVTTGPIHGSTKRSEQVAGFPGMRIPVRRVNLSNGEHLDLYDSSGPYAGDSAVTELATGLRKTRDAGDRSDPTDGAATQLVWAWACCI